MPNKAEQPIEKRVRGLPYKQEDIDIEVRDIVNALNIGCVPTLGCCSGHNKERGYILLKDGRTLIILPSPSPKESLVRELEFNQKIRIPIYSEQPDFIECKNCGMLILRNKQRCPNCGQKDPFNQQLPNDKLLDAEIDKFLSDEKWCLDRDGLILPLMKKFAKAQRDLIASLKDAEFREYEQELRRYQEQKVKEAKDFKDAEHERIVGEIVNDIVVERKIYKLTQERHLEIKPNDKQSIIFYKGYMRALQVIISLIKAHYLEHK